MYKSPIEILTNQLRLEQEGNDSCDRARDHKACEDPAEKSYPEFSLIFHFLFPFLSIIGIK